MKTFNDLKIGDKIYFVDFNSEEGLNSAYAAEVISLKKNIGDHKDNMQTSNK